MAKNKIELFREINNEKEFEHILISNVNNLMCAEVYSKFVGSCTALDRLITTIKLDWSDGKMVFLKVPADNIESLKRFRDQSEPVYMFISNQKVSKVFRGVNRLKFAELAKEELCYFNKQLEGVVLDRPTYELYQATPDETEWMNARAAARKHEVESLTARRIARQAARKRHRAELMVPYLQNLNFVLFWPHCKHAHPELYERWDVNNIIMVGREELQLTKDVAQDILYAGDAPINEASMYELLNGKALAICFRLLDTEKHFVSLVRKILYEEIPQYDDNKQLEDQFPPMTAFNFYKTYSLTKEEILQRKKEERLKQKEEAKEKRARRLSEMQRLARQAIEDARELKRAEKEQHKLQLLKTGNIAALEQLNREPSEEISIVVPEVRMNEEGYDKVTQKLIDEEYSDEEEIDIGCHPPAGLLIPGFYAPPNDIAKANALAILFPKLVIDHVTPQPEFLPPHVLMMLDISKRYKAIEILTKHQNAVIHFGVFKAESPYKGIHIAHSVKEYDTRLDTNSKKIEDVKMAIMLSMESDLPLLELMDLGPVHVSRDVQVGEEECAAMFPVEYVDGYPEFEDFK